MTQKGAGFSIMFINQKNQEFYEPELKQKKSRYKLRKRGDKEK